MINYTVHYDEELGGIYDKSCHFICDVSSKAHGNEIVKRINMHDELISKLNEVLSLHNSDYVSEQSHSGECGDVIGHVIGFEMLDSIEQLLEKCK